MEGRPVGRSVKKETFRAATVIQKIGDERLKLYAGKGYWYFVFDDGKLYRTHSVDVMRLSHMPLEQWIAEGNDFLKWMTAKTVKE
jgi:hypothetical protein